MTEKQHKQWCKDLAEIKQLKSDLAAKGKRIEQLERIILLAPGTDEKDFLKTYKKWWDAYYRELRSPGCNLLTIEQALTKKGGG